MFKQINRGLCAQSAIAILFSIVLVGCGGSSFEPVVRAYDAGYDDGFSEDGEYYDGYIHSAVTEGPAPIFYTGHLIPFLNDDSYDAGYYDGLFDAYNDGYFVAYRYAFIIGFSEGYDAAFFFDYLDFLFLDDHFEYLHGGFSDGYNDGFSEGRVFGAFDYEAGLLFDWLDAFLDWESGTDLFFEEVGVGTGAFGPVELYEWGTNPFDLFSREEGDGRVVAGNFAPMRATGESKSVTDDGRELERPLTDELADDLSIAPPFSERSERALTLDSTWLERIDAYSVAGSAKEATAKEGLSTRATSPRAR